jgi:hypothetical protein
MTDLERLAKKVRDLWEAGALSSHTVGGVLVMSDFCAAVNGYDSKIVATQITDGKELKS